MSKPFDSEEARRFLLAKEELAKKQREEERIVLLAKVISTLKTELQGFSVEVYLVGSIVQPFQFYPHSDIDIVVKNYTGDRFDLWVKMENALGRQVEIIPFETCHFQEFVLKAGFKVL